MTYHDVELPMRLSKLRRPRRCLVCEEFVTLLWVVRREPVQHTADGRSIWRERPAHNAEVCEACVESLAAERETGATIRPLERPAP